MSSASSSDLRLVVRSMSSEDHGAAAVLHEMRGSPPKASRIAPAGARLPFRTAMPPCACQRLVDRADDVLVPVAGAFRRRSRPPAPRRLAPCLCSRPASPSMRCNDRQPAGHRRNSSIRYLPGRHEIGPASAQIAAEPGPNPRASGRCPPARRSQANGLTALVEPAVWPPLDPDGVLEGFARSGCRRASDRP